MYNNAATFSSLRNKTNDMRNSEEIFISASRRTTSGSRRPMRTNSASALGNVAEKSNVCLTSATELMICFN